jgi:hypothetical protein
MCHKSDAFEKLYIIDSIDNIDSIASIASIYSISLPPLSNDQA